LWEKETEKQKKAKSGEDRMESRDPNMLKRTKKSRLQKRLNKEISIR
jgi:hypothetical protein